MWLTMKNFNWGSLKNKILRMEGGGGRLTKKEYRGGSCLTWWSWRVCRFKGELGKKVGSGVFEGGLIP